MHEVRGCHNEGRILLVVPYLFVILCDILIIDVCVNGLDISAEEK